jgi:APA family basic amino acid/polyamine antiporter
LGVIMVGLLYAGQGNWDTPAGEASGGGAFGLAMILILYCYGGWNDAALVAAEQSDRRRNIPRALIIGTLLITLLYLLINAAYLFALNFEGAASSRAIASEVLAKPFGERGGRIMSLLVVVSALGAINAQIYTSARIHSRLGEDFRSLRWLAWWSPRGGSPIPALVSQMVITLTLIFLVGSPRGKAIVDQCLDSVGFGAIAWEGYGGFETLLRCSAPFFWLFFLMTGLALFILRFRDKATERPFRVPFYPITPMLFCLTSLYMLYSSATYAGSLILIGGVPLIAGFLLYVLYIQRQYVPNT